MRSRLVALVPGLLAVATVPLTLAVWTAAAWAGDSPGPSSAGSMSLRIYSSYSTPEVQWRWDERARWSYGAALGLAVSDRVTLTIDASRYESNGQTLSPYVIGASFGPADARRVRPFVELGGGYYRLGLGKPILRGFPVALSSSGNTRDLYLSDGDSRPDHRDAAGAYFGLGMDWTLSSHLGLNLGARAHTWSDTDLKPSSWDGLVGLRAGITILLSRETQGRWASR